jgi:hypothetical protein
MVVCVWGLAAADGPVIRSATVDLSAEGAVSFQFEGRAGESGGFQVEVATGLGEATVWQTQPQVPLTEVMPGLYEVVIPWHGDKPASFYRVVAWGSAAARLFVNEIASANVSGFADAGGRYWDWIEIYNPGEAAVDLMGYGLSDDTALPYRWRFPSVLIQPGGYVLVFASGLDLAEPGGELHASFRLNADGESLRLTAPDRRTVDQVQLPPLEPDHSAGRLPDGGDSWHVYTPAQATPGAGI